MEKDKEIGLLTSVLCILLLFIISLSGFSRDSSLGWYHYHRWSLLFIVFIFLVLAYLLMIGLIFKFKYHNKLISSSRIVITSVLYSFVSLVIGVFFHEIGHYIPSYFYDLNPYVGFSDLGIFILSDNTTTYIKNIVMNGGLLANLTIVFILFLFYLFKYQKEHKNGPFFYIISFILLANLLLALVSLILFMYIPIL